MQIDSHNHFWRYNRKEYGWISDDMAQLRNDFMPLDLLKNIQKCGIDGVVSVQARQALYETDWILELAEENDFIRGVVGWLPLAECSESMLEEYASIKKFKGVRHVIQDEPDDNFILGESFNKGIKLLKNYDLTYDILIFEHHLPNAIRFVDFHPEQRFILDHIAKPKISIAEVEPWAGNLRKLGERKNVWCKLSGMITEADFRNWTDEQLDPYMEIVMEAFGPERLMFGSDWPVCLAAGSYENWYQVVLKFIERLSSDEKKRIMGGNAIEVYNLQG